MKKIVNECVGCRDIGLPCMGDRCSNRRVRRLYCDKCKDGVDKLYKVKDDELCESCMHELFEREHLICDECGFESDELFNVDGVKMCEYCLTDYFPKVIDDE